ncbi:cyclic AMP-responsive element-binding protein 3-like protein 4 isoform X2 [Rhincodon typus]|nr:cyclic AMP-responsive element-binding protein 3-like protein 4 isoform X2 [Rhincodon typus]XP_048476431.1 cyclic AMP-responsive element-binding protein 3-like protein 4 isoform X2 [Rhincodon typus]XP_048476432.1 cyclic AMP-responsive element-binding protein 3-like protein 4 isoform X2 [Rhincodon typus]
MNAANEEPLGVYYREYTVFLESGYSASNSSYPGQEDNGTTLEKLLEEWAVPTTNSLNESESEEVFQTMINPNEVLSSSVNTIEGASETDSGISDDHRPESPQPSESGPDPGAGPSGLCQLVYGVSNIKSQRAASNTDLVSVELGGWNTTVIVPEACVVDTAPGSVKRTLSVTDSDSEVTDCLIGVGRRRCRKADTTQNTQCQHNHQTACLTVSNTPTHTTHCSIRQRERDLYPTDGQHLRERRETPYPSESQHLQERRGTPYPSEGQHLRERRETS